MISLFSKIKEYFTKENIAFISLVIIIFGITIYKWMNPYLEFYRVSKEKLNKKIVATKISDLENVTAVNNDLVITKTGQVYLWRSPKDYEMIYDLKINNENFVDDSLELGLLGVCRINNTRGDSSPLRTMSRIYLSFTEKISNSNSYRLIINEYSNDMKLTRNIDTINLPTDIHHSGTLQELDGNLIVSTGDGGPQGDPKNNAQNINSKLGKILMYNINRENVSSKVLIYGLRNPWKFWISPEKVIYIGNVGYNTVESIYRIDLKPILENMKPINCGWRVYEGSYKREVKDIKNVVMPFFEYPNNYKTGKCVIGGFLVDNYYILGDYVTGTIRLLNNSGEEVLEERTGLEIYSLGMMKNENGSYGPVICARDGVYWMSFKEV